MMYEVIVPKSVQKVIDALSDEKLRYRIEQWSGQFFIVNDRMRVSGSPEDQILTV